MMRTVRTAAVVLLAMLVACTTGEKMSRIHEGMTKAEVVGALGEPDGFRRAGNAEALTYANRLISGWSYDKADYNVVLTDGRVTAYGPGTVRPATGPQMLMIMPIGMPR